MTVDPPRITVKDGKTIFERYPVTWRQRRRTNRIERMRASLVGIEARIEKYTQLRGHSDDDATLDEWAIEAAEIAGTIARLEAKG